MPDFAHRRVAAGLPMAGVFIASASLPIGTVIADLVIVAQASVNADWDERGTYLPL